MSAMDMLVEAASLSVDDAAAVIVRIRFIENQIEDINDGNEAVGFPRNESLEQCKAAVADLVAAQVAIRDTLISIEGKLRAVRDG